MNEADRHGMKRLPLQLIGTSSAGIQRVAKQRMTNASHVHTDLVGAPGLQFKLHVCVPLKAFQNLVMGDGRLAVFSLIAIFLRSIGWRPIGALTATLLLFHYTVYNAAVAPVHGMFLDLLRNKDMALIIFADNQ